MLLADSDLKKAAWLRNSPGAGHRVRGPQPLTSRGGWGSLESTEHWDIEEGDDVELTLRIPADEVLNVETLFKLKSAGAIDDDVIRFIPKPGPLGQASHYECVLEGDEVEYLLELLSQATDEHSLRVWRLKREDQLTLQFPEPRE